MSGVANTIKVLVVDDSAIIRGMLSQVLNADPEISVVGTAVDPYDARAKIKQLRPDVVTLDVEMPRMNGIEFLEKLTRLHPTPVVMISTLTQRGADVSLEALRLGAFDVVGKPSAENAKTLALLAKEIIAKVKAARDSPAHLIANRRLTGGAAGAAGNRSVIAQLNGRGADQMIAIGASTGGTEAVAVVLAAMPPDSPPVVIAQHIPPAFSGPFAARLDRAAQLTVRELNADSQLECGHAYVAPGNRHVVVARSGGRWRAKLDDGEPRNRHKPSVDVLFDSLVVSSCPARVVAILLTGMGRDGAEGMLALRTAGAATIVQDEASSVVWGMPGSAHKLGAAKIMSPLETVAEAIIGELGR